MKPKILVVGSMNMDLVMSGMKTLPSWGTTVNGESYRYAPGGKGSNQALAAARLGADCYLVGRVGDDPNGQILLDSLEKAGVHTQYVVTDPQKSTGLAVLHTGEEGRYFCTMAPGANSAMEVGDVEKAIQENHFDLIMLQLEMPLELVWYICDLGKRTGISVFLDAGPAMKLPLDRLAGTTVISPNEAETEALTGITPDTEEHILDAAKKIYDEAGPRYVLLKLGERGAFLYADQTRLHIPAFHVNAVDTTAAGDTFGAAFAIQYCLGGRSLEEAVRYGNAAAALCVTRKGGHPSIPAKEEVDSFFALQSQ